MRTYEPDSCKIASTSQQPLVLFPWALVDTRASQGARRLLRYLSFHPCHVHHRFDLFVVPEQGNYRIVKLSKVVGPIERSNLNPCNHSTFKTHESEVEGVLSSRLRRIPLFWFWRGGKTFPVDESKAGNERAGETPASSARRIVHFGFLDNILLPRRLEFPHVMEWMDGWMNFVMPLIAFQQCIVPASSCRFSVDRNVLRSESQRSKSSSQEAKGVVIYQNGPWWSSSWSCG
jgi:hypothetical protein